MLHKTWQVCYDTYMNTYLIQLVETTFVVNSTYTLTLVRNTVRECEQYIKQMYPVGIKIVSIKVTL